MPSAEWDDDDPDNPPPAKPPGLDLNLWFDVGPMRPDEWGEQRAMAWSQATRDQAVHRDAVEDVRQEAAGFGRLAAAIPAGEIG